ncbi:MAG: GTP-binding protein, partial [Gammaproteobacteria bacterium]
LTAIETGDYKEDQLAQLLERAGAVKTTPVLGITGTGGAGKSSTTDEIVRRFRQDSAEQLSIAIIAVDPTRRKTGGALLGDRIRMNAIGHPDIYMRSVATRNAAIEIPQRLAEMLAALKLAGFDLVIVETPGIGQGDAGIVPYVDSSLYVMTPEFGAATQLEKIDMLDFADVFAINKFDRKGAEDAMRDVCKQVQRNREAFDRKPEEMPVFGTIASRFNDDGITALYQCLVKNLKGHGLKQFEQQLPSVITRVSSQRDTLIPIERQRYLAEIAGEVRDYHKQVEQQARLAREKQQLLASRAMLATTVGHDAALTELDALAAQRDQALDPRARRLLETWPSIQDQYSGQEFTLQVR